MLLRIWHITVKEFIQYRRDRVFMLFLFLFPVLQLVLIARATAGDPINLPTAVLDQDRSAVSRGIMQALDNTQELMLVAFPQGVTEVERALDGSQVLLAVIIPPGFSAAVTTADHAQV